MEAEIGYTELAMGQRIKLLTTGWEQGHYTGAAGCPKEGQVVTVTSVPMNRDYVGTTGGLIVNRSVQCELMEGQEPLANMLPQVGLPGSVHIGTDPEVFAMHASGKVMPAWEYLPNKHPAAPHQFWDGFQAELTTLVATCLIVLTNYVQQGLKVIYKAAQAKSPNATLSWQPVMEIDEGLMQGISKKHAELGCDPSFSAYGDPPLAIPDPRSLLLRFAGCHLHFGGPIDPAMAPEVVKTMDSVCGLLMVPVLRGMDNPLRRRFYGRAGEYRLPPHGLEYRTPSSAVMASPLLYHMTFELARLGHRLGQLRYTDADLWGIGEAEVQRIINECDVDTALQVIERRPQVAKALLSKIPNGPAATRLVTEGAINLLPNLDNLAKAWHLTGDEPDWNGVSSKVNGRLANAKFQGQGG